MYFIKIDTNYYFTIVWFYREWNAPPWRYSYSSERLPPEMRASLYLSPSRSQVARFIKGKKFVNYTDSKHSESCNFELSTFPFFIKHGWSCNMFTQVAVIKKLLIINNKTKLIYTAGINNSCYQSPLHLPEAS